MTHYGLIICLMWPLPGANQTHTFWKPSDFWLHENVSSLLLVHSGWFSIGTGTNPDDTHDLMGVRVNIPLLRARAAGAVPWGRGGVGAWVQQTAQTGILGSQKYYDQVGQHSAE